MAVKIAVAQKAKTATTKKASFQFNAPQAKYVAVVGTFNNWDSASSPLEKDKKGIWKGTLALVPGRYEYRYFVDGSWQDEQRSAVERVSNGLGAQNCVIKL